MKFNIFLKCANFEAKFILYLTCVSFVLLNIDIMLIFTRLKNIVYNESKKFR